MVDDSVGDVNQGFPKIAAPFINSDGTINGIWLRLLITLWNRTGLGPGVSTSDAMAFATMRENSQARDDGSNTEIVFDLGASDVASQFQTNIFPMVLDMAQQPATDPLISELLRERISPPDHLEALLFDTQGSGTSSTPVTATDVPVFAPMVTGELPGPTLIANVDGTCIMAQVDCVENTC